MNRTARQTGFTLTEMLIVLILLGLVMTLGGQLFQSTIRASHGAVEAQNAAGSIDAAVAALRADAWAASGTDVAADGQSATIKLPGERSVTWTVAGNGRLARDSGGLVRTWPVAVGTRFAASGPELIVRIPATKSSPGGAVRMASQMQLLGRLAS